MQSGYHAVMRIGLLGASGYSGGELLRYLERHPDFELDYVAAGSNAGAPITSVHPQLRYLEGRSFEETSIARANQVDLLFVALPHGESAAIVSELDSEVRIVDLGADYRLTDQLAWDKYYGGDYAGSWTYGLPEIHGNRELIKNSNRVANPGCYATSVILAAAPFVVQGLIDSQDITVVAASGTTGAGRSVKTHLLASEVMGSLTSYKFGGTHQHTPEIEQALASLINSDQDRSPRVSFTPILAPMPRGILATITAKTSAKVKEELVSAFRHYYQDASFIHLLEKSLPQTSSVVGSNHVHVAVELDQHTSRWIASIAIDNLGKGAAGQAIQNANLMVGLDEGLALLESGLGT
jgi:N-acetyl-gamma-glutamyl-phosphate reductase